jgi:hypothetical protein
MKLRFLSACAVAACALWAGAPANATAQEAKPAPDEKKAEQPKLSGGERSAAEKIDKAKGPEAKLQAANEFIKKYPQSALRPKVVELLAAEISNVQDAQLRSSLAETFAAIFTGPGEADRVAVIVLDGHITADRAEEAFRAAGPWLQQHPDDFDTMRRLATTALNASIRGNNAFLAQGQQYGNKALELLAADKRPENIDAAKWAENKEKWEMALQREVGIIAMRAGDAATARKHLERAAELKHTDPVVYLVLGDMLNQEYNTQVKLHTVASAAEKPAALQKAQATLDRVIETYAQALALSEGNPQFAQAAAALRENLTAYYKYRHNNSTDGLQQLIDRYKRPSQ